jgi:hypothetical protein
MANATLSPKELADLLARLEDAQRMMDAVRNQLIQAMAARHKPPSNPPSNARRRREAATRARR